MSGVIVHEWVEAAGGAERVVEQFVRAFPDADLRVLWDDAPGRFDTLSTETWLARTPVRRHKALALPLTIPTWRLLGGARDYDWMLVSSHMFAHHAKFRGQNTGIPKYVYVHTPARYIWTPELDERGAHPAIRAVSPLLQTIDRSRAQEATALAANSQFVKERIARVWDRDPVVIHPPVDVEGIADVDRWSALLTDEEHRQLEALPQEFILGVSRFIPYKRLDLVIAAAEIAGVPAVIAGRGPEEAALRERAASATVPVIFVVSPSDSMLYALFQRASVFVFPPIEDFGIVPVEAQVLGTPIVTGPVGGQLETFTNGTTGIIADSTDPADLASAVERAIDLQPFDGPAITARFSPTAFRQRIQKFVQPTMSASGRLA